MTQIICITGEKRHGKGEVGHAISRLVPGTVEVGFADRLKISMMRSLGFDLPTDELIALADEAKVSWGIFIINRRLSLEHSLTGRELFQQFGTEGGRLTFGDTFWIDQVLPDPMDVSSPALNAVEQAVSRRYDNAPVVAITDCRFDNEAERAIDCGGEVWKVVRPGVEGGDTHASEAGVSDPLINHIIVNDGSLEQLQWRVEQALELTGVIKS